MIILFFRKMLIISATLRNREVQRVGLIQRGLFSALYEKVCACMRIAKLSANHSTKYQQSITPCETLVHI